MLALATLSVGTHAYATEPAGPGTSSDAAQPQAAPIVHAYADQDGTPNSNSPAYRPMPDARGITSLHPIAGVSVRVDANASVDTVSANAKVTELRIVRGIANVSIHHPEKNVRVLVDRPGGQTALLKDGLYTFNAETNIVRVLKGEADAYPGSAVDGIKVKEDHQFAFGASTAGTRAVESSREELTADYLPPNSPAGDGPARLGYGPYGDGYYGYPAYGYYGYPYGFGNPYGYGFGLGFGYYGGFGGFRGGGFRGRFR